MLKQLHKASLVGRSGARHNFERFHYLRRLIVAEGSEIGSGDVLRSGARVAPQPHLPPNLHSGAGGVAGNDFHVDSGFYTHLNSVGNLLAHRVADCCDSYEGERQSHIAIDNGCGVRGHFGIGKSECAHRFALIFGKFCLDGGTVAPGGKGGGVADEDFGSTLHIEQSPAKRRTFDLGCHEFALGGERHLRNHAALLAHGEIVGPLVVEPQKQRTLGGIAYHAHFAGSAVEVSR